MLASVMCYIACEITLQTLIILGSEPAGPLFSGKIYGIVNKSVMQAGCTAVCSCMQHRVEIQPPTWPQSRLGRCGCSNDQFVDRLISRLCNVTMGQN